jgi:hypothetical protein
LAKPLQSKQKTFGHANETSPTFLKWGEGGEKSLLDYI